MAVLSRKDDLPQLHVTASGFARKYFDTCFFLVTCCPAWSILTDLFGLHCAMKEVSEFLSPGNEALETPWLPLTLKSSFRNLWADLLLPRDTLHCFSLPFSHMPAFSSVAFSPIRTSFLSWWLQFCLCSEKSECIKTILENLSPFEHFPHASGIVPPAHPCLCWSQVKVTSRNTGIDILWGLNSR